MVNKGAQTDSKPKPRGFGETRVESDDEGGPLAPGDWVGEYKVKELGGQGGMGWVYFGIHPVISKEVAIKVLKAGVAEKRGLVERFVQEARAVNLIRHPNIVDIFAFGELEDGSSYYVMEALEGESLRHKLRGGRGLDREMLKMIFEGVLDALAAAHDLGIVHRDLKPDNVFVVEGRYGGPSVKLLDFGIAKLTEMDLVEGQPESEMPPGPLGTPYYMSPEACRGEDVDGRADLYSVGVLLYEVFVGRVPFRGASYTEVLHSHAHRPVPPPSGWGEIPAGVEALIMRCLDKRPSARFSSATELKERLSEVFDSLGDEELPAHLEASNAGGGGRGAGLRQRRIQGGEVPSMPTELSTAAQSLAPGESTKSWMWWAVGAVVALLGFGTLYWVGVDRPFSAEERKERGAGGGDAGRRLTTGKRAEREAGKADTVSLSFVSQPPGAGVFLGGEWVGETPVSVSLPRGSKPTQVELRLAGRGVLTEEVVPSSDRFIEVVFPVKNKGSEQGNGAPSSPRERPSRATRSPRSPRPRFDPGEFKLER